MDSVVITALIGVAGTLLGTLLGWMLSKIDFGKLIVSTNNITIKRLKISEIAGSKRKQITLYINFIISLYNNSNSNQVMRDGFIVLIGDNRKELNRFSIDGALLTQTNELPRFAGEVGVINVLPKHCYDIEVKNEIVYEEQICAYLKKIVLFC